MKRILIQRSGTHTRVLDLDTMEEVEGYKTLDLKPKAGEKFRARIVFEPEVVDVQVLDAPQLDLFPCEAHEEDEQGDAGGSVTALHPKLLTSGKAS